MSIPTGVARIYADVKCFWIEPTGLEFVYAMRSKEGRCPAASSGSTWHRAKIDLGTNQTSLVDGQWRREDARDCFDGHVLPADARFICACGLELTDGDGRGSVMQYRRPDTGQLFDRVNDAGPGAMWDATWYRDMVGGNYLPHMPADGRIICVTLPNGRDWVIDSRCSNCTLPDDKVHACWVRTGEPPNLTVGKSGFTCAAGAGSIISGDYHGFLRNGILTTA